MNTTFCSNSLDIRACSNTEKNPQKRDSKFRKRFIDEQQHHPSS